LKVPFRPFSPPQAQRLCFSGSLFSPPPLLPCDVGPGFVFLLRMWPGPSAGGKRSENGGSGSAPAPRTTLALRTPPPPPPPPCPPSVLSLARAFLPASSAASPFPSPPIRHCFSLPIPAEHPCFQPTSNASGRGGSAVGEGSGNRLSIGLLDGVDGGDRSGRHVPAPRETVIAGPAVTAPSAAAGDRDRPFIHFALLCCDCRPDKKGLCQHLRLRLWSKHQEAQDRGQFKKERDEAGTRKESRGGGIGPAR